MWIVIVTIISYLLSQKCLGLNLIDLPVSTESDISNIKEHIQRRNAEPQESTKATTEILQFRGKEDSSEKQTEPPTHEETKETDLKSKIATLVQLKIRDTDEKIIAIKDLQDANRNSPPYKVGFILSMVKKAREVLNELFNVAVKHRISWKALEQLKILELIVHTNVDTSHLVRQLIEIHLEYVNGTKSIRRRVLVI